MLIIWIPLKRGRLIRGVVGVDMGSVIYARTKVIIVAWRLGADYVLMASWSTQNCKKKCWSSFRNNEVIMTEQSLILHKQASNWCEQRIWVWRTPMSPMSSRWWQITFCDADLHVIGGAVDLDIVLCVDYRRQQQCRKEARSHLNT